MRLAHASVLCSSKRATPRGFLAGLLAGLAAGTSIQVAPARASGMSTTCQYSTDPSGKIFAPAQYDIGRAYAAAGRVLVVEALDPPMRTPQRLRVIEALKGARAPDVELPGRRCQGTACTGFALPQGGRFLVLLRGTQPEGKVDGEGNDACPNAFEVRDDRVRIGGRELRLSEVKRYLSQKPAPIPY